MPLPQSAADGGDVSRTANNAKRTMRGFESLSLPQPDAGPVTGEAVIKAEEVEDERPDEAKGILALAHRRVAAAVDALLKTPPTTLAGAREAIGWFAEYDRPNVPETSGKYIQTLARSPIFAHEEA
jgi:hypothetical protein